MLGCMRMGKTMVMRLLLLTLCAAYIQGPIMKIWHFDGAVAEMQHFGLHSAAPMAVLVILFELCASAMLVPGYGRRPAAFALAAFTLVATMVALRFWNLPVGTQDRMMAMNAYFEHLGLAAAFVLVGIGLGQKEMGTFARHVTRRA